MNLVLSPKFILLHSLQAAIASSTIALKEIPLQRSKDCKRVQYISAIALKLAKGQQSAMDIAAQIAGHCSENDENRSFLSREDFTIKVVPPGMILFELTDVGVAFWLQSLTSNPQPIGNTEFFQDSDRVFPIQYSHARCCSLLRLAHRERMITLDECDRDSCPLLWQLITPKPIPWLDSNHCLRLVHPAELNLISQLLTTLDALASLENSESQALLSINRSVNWIKLANALSEAFQTFYSQCRIWGEVKTDMPKLAQARLGLVIATQSLLRLILQDLLGVFAPLEL
ncbi:MAG TPA: DALR anticodon-binding domain-containing protein [Kamptonema sp.]|nr:DALR anticodon-binding domain-containing protein [Kamptonema sp.]